MNLSIIIPICHTGREKNLETCLHFLKMQSFQEFETILVEQVFDRKYYEGFPVTRYYAIKDERLGRYNKSWMLNVGARKALYSNLFFFDPDVICDRNYLVACIPNLKDWFVGWRKFYMLSQKNTDKVIAEKFYHFDFGKEEWISPTMNGACGSAVWVKARFFFDKLGGFNENFIGWGGEDNDFVYRAMWLSRVDELKTVNAGLAHLEHPRGHTYGDPNNNDALWKTHHNVEIVNRRLVNANLGKMVGYTRIKTEDLQ